MTAKPGLTLATFVASQSAREEEYLRALLEAADWSLYRAAKLAGCRKSTLQAMLRRHLSLEAERIRRTENRPPGKIR